MPASLSLNQREALTRPCRKCGGLVTEHNGRYGPWVQCFGCGDKIRRPRGRPFATTQQPPAAPQVAPTTPPVAPQVAPVGIEAAILGLVQPKIEAALSAVSVDAQQVLRVVRDEMDKLQAARPTVIEVRRPDAAPVQIEGAHYLMARLLRLLGAGLDVYLWGPPGSGKTTAAMQAAGALGRRAEIDTLDPTTFRSMVQGYRTPDGEPVHTAFSRCWSQGMVYVADETDNAPGHVQTLFNSALANGHAPLAWGSVARADGFGFIGTGNTPGRPTRAFPDRRPMSAAFMDRLYFLYWPVDPAIEARAGGLPIPAAPDRATGRTTPAEWATLVFKIREWAERECPTLMVTPRATLTGLRALDAGETPAEVADGLIFRGADAEITRKAYNAVSVVVVR